MLKRMKITNPTQQQKDDAEKKAIEEHHAILFLLGADKYKYGKLIEDLKNDVILRKTLSPKLCLTLVTYYPNGRTVTVENITAEKMCPTMVLPSQL